MRTTLPTPGKASRFSVSNCSTSPTRPTIVRCTPRLTKAEPPAASTVRTTASSSSAVASDVITTTIVAGLLESYERKKPRAKCPGLVVAECALLLHPTEQRPGPGVIAKEPARHVIDATRIAGSSHLW